MRRSFGYLFLPERSVHRHVRLHRHARVELERLDRRPSLILFGCALTKRSLDADKSFDPVKEPCTPQDRYVRKLCLRNVGERSSSRERSHMRKKIIAICFLLCNFLVLRNDAISLQKR